MIKLYVLKTTYHKVAKALALFACSTLSCAHAQMPEIPNALKELVDKISDAGPGPTQAQKLERKRQFDAIKNIKVVGKLPMICGVGRAKQGSNRISIITARNETINVRLAWVYAPDELQLNGSAARLRVVNWVHGYTVCVNPVHFSGTGQDKIRRFIGTIILSSGEDMGLELLKQGLAWHWVEYAQKGQDPKQYKEYAAAHKWAKDGRVGVFQATDPVPPWNFNAITIK